MQRIVQSHADAMNLFIGKPDMQVQYEKEYSALAGSCDRDE